MGGIELHLGDLAKGLAARGVEAQVLTATPGPDWVDGVRAQRIASIRAPRFGFSISPFLARDVARRLREGGFDMVHAHASVASPLALAGVIAARRLGLPVVATFHSMLFRAATALRWSSWIWGWHRQPVHFTAVSARVARQASEALGRDVSVLPNGIDLAAWRELPFRGPPGDRPIALLAAMRLVSKKRPLELIDAFQIARKIASANDRDLHLCIAGDGPERGRLEARIKNSGLAEHVDLLGALPRAAVRDLHARSDIFVLPSTREAFGLAALEARASGLPVIAMAGSGADEFLDPELTALLAADDRVFAANIAKLAADDELRARLSPRDPGLIRFDWSRVERDHLDAYAKAVELLKN